MVKATNAKESSKEKMIRKLILLILLSLVSAQHFLRSMVGEINSARRRVSVRPVCISPRLTTIAQRYADLQASRRRGGHYVDGRSPESRIPYYSMAENLFEGFGGAGSGSARMAMGELMQDVPHRHNILDPDFTHVGVGRAVVDRAGQSYYYWVQIFARTGEPCRFWRFQPTLPGAIIPPEERMVIRKRVREPYPGAGGVEEVEEVRKTYLDSVPPIDESSSWDHLGNRNHPFNDPAHPINDPFHPANNPFHPLNAPVHPYWN